MRSSLLPAKILFTRQNNVRKEDAASYEHRGRKETGKAPCASGRSLRAVSGAGTSKTSVEDITSRAKVGKGTFYLYFADKGSVTQALLARVSYQLLDNACAAAEQHAAELTSFPTR